jgi:hypothetical protein
MTIFPTGVYQGDYERGFHDGQRDRKRDDARNDYERGYRDGYGGWPNPWRIAPTPYYPVTPYSPTWVGPTYDMTITGTAN